MSLFFFLILGGCTKSADLKEKPKSLKIGGSFSLLSLDQYSINSLGDSLIYSLLYDDVFKLNENKISSKILNDIKLRDKSLFFNKVSKNLFVELNKSYSEGLKSPLWSSHFKRFKLNNQSLKNLGKGSLQDLKIISSYFKLKGERFGRYRVADLIKNQRLKLEKKKLDGLSHLPSKITFYKIKSIGQGLKSLQARRIDFYINSNTVIDESLRSGFKNLKFIKDKEKSVFLRLYKKQDEKNYLAKTIKQSMPQIKKVLSKDFVKNKESLKFELKPDESYKDLRLLFNESSYQKVLDIWSPVYTSLSGRDLIYSSLSDQSLYKALVSGEFEYYLSFDVEKKKKEVSYESFHSLGKYNTYRLKSSSLDLVLEQKLKEWNLENRKKLNDKALKALSILPYVVLEYEAPYFKIVVHKDMDLRMVEDLF